MAAPLAIARAVGGSFARALAAVPAEPPIDVARAREQHAAYVEGLTWLGWRVDTLAADERFPDGCFVEDRAVVAEGAAVVTASAVASRAGEADAVAAALARAGLDVVRMAPPATLDGGDCLQLGRRFYVGRSVRTNDGGVAALRAAFAPRGFDVIPVPLDGILHLKCVCAPLPGDRVLLAEGTIPRATFGAAEVVMAPAEEAYAANVVAREDRVLVAAGFPRTAAALAAAGFTVRALATSEFRKADGALTCLSLRT